MSALNKNEIHLLEDDIEQQHSLDAYHHDASFQVGCVTRAAAEDGSYKQDGAVSWGSCSYSGSERLYDMRDAMDAAAKAVGGDVRLVFRLVT